MVDVGEWVMLVLPHSHQEEDKEKLYTQLEKICQWPLADFQRHGKNQFTEFLEDFLGRKIDFDNFFSL